MKRFACLLLLLHTLTACAGPTRNPPPLASNKDLGVPDKLADQFEAHDVGTAPVPAPKAPEPPPSEPVKETKKGKKGKKEKVAKGTRGKKGDKAAKDSSAPAAAMPAEIPNRWSMAPFFKEGERTVFDITYFGATAGQLELDVLPEKVVADRPTFHFRAIASSTSVFSLFYRVNDVAESFMDTTGLFSHKFSIKLDESRQTRDVLELYDQSKRKAYYWSKWNMSGKPEQDDKSEIDLVPFTQDGLSSFFYVRTLPLELGKSYEFPVVNNGKLRTVRVTAVRKENLTTRMGEFPTIVVKPEVVLDGVMQSYGDSFMWVSDDKDRQILKIDAKIKVGSVIAYLRERSFGNSAEASK
jgi:hypothetical protein